MLVLTGQTTLAKHHARSYWEGVRRAVELLLGPHDVSISKPDDHDQTLFSFTAKSGDKAVVKLLLGREDVDLGKQVGYMGPNATLPHYYYPLAWGSNGANRASRATNPSAISD